MYQIGIDIGGTNVKIGLLNEALELCAEISIPFPHTTAEDMAAQIRAAVGPMLQARGAALSDVESLGAVVPGSIDAAGETVVDAHNLNFHNVPLRKILSDAFPGIPVYIANDARGAREDRRGRLRGRGVHHPLGLRDCRDAAGGDRGVQARRAVPLRHHRRRRPAAVRGDRESGGVNALHKKAFPGREGFFMGGKPPGGGPGALDWVSVRSGTSRGRGASGARARS